MLAPNKIRFAGIFSNELNMPDLIMDCAFDSDNSEMNTFLTREAVASETHDGRKKHISLFKYTESFSPKFTFLKKGFGDFNQDEIRALLKYLTQKDTAALLEVYDDDSNVVSWASIGNFSEIQLYKIANKRTVGVTAVWDSISPFVLSDLHTITKTIDDPKDNKIVIEIDTDDNKPVYPNIIIEHTGSVIRIPDGTIYTVNSDMVENTVYFNGLKYYWKTSEAIDYTYFHESDKNPMLEQTSIRLTNKHTDFLNRVETLSPVIVKNNNPSEVITIDCANSIIVSNSVNRVFDTDFVDWRWLPLLDGKNEITIEGNCTITLQWREVRKIGEW